MLSSNDISQLKEKQITEKQISDQLEQFKRGFDPMKLSSPALVQDGILKVSESEADKYVALYESSDASVLKFVPASGAASRMFKDLFELIESVNDEISTAFFENIQRFAFYPDLKKVFERNHTEEFEKAVKQKDRRVIQALLLEEGLDYGNLPKGLLRFHSYPHEIRTPIHEHLEEGLAYANKRGKVKIHFTVSPSHQEIFEQHVQEVLTHYPEDIQIIVNYSTQKTSTDTIAVDAENLPFRDDEGTLLFRPAGHGALLENLNQLEEEVIFIKNIDNVVPDRIKDETIKYKKILAGVLISYQQKAFQLLEQADRGLDISKEGLRLLGEMGLKGKIAKEEVADYLNRPIRVCGMVKNQGEPGGGPFWVKSEEKITLQIVESAQVNKTDPDQKAIFEGSTHFNPVDLVCGIRNYKGESFDLLTYRDDQTGFITEKSFQGRKLKAMELPGLWNGGMAHWNTIFVEVPLITFNPVKTVMDLLKENHQ